MNRQTMLYRVAAAWTALVLCVASADAQNPNVGTSGAKFLLIPVGARSAAIGGAYIGLADDALSIFANPAGIARVQSTTAQFSGLRWFDAFNINGAAIVHNAGDWGSLGMSLLVCSMDRVEITTETSPNGTGRFYDAQDVALGLSYGRYLTTQFNVGITAKYVYQRIWNEVADGIAFDIGTQYHIEFQNMTIAMTMANFGGDLRFDGPDLDITYLQNSNYPISRLAPARLHTDGFPMPLRFQVGIAMDVLTTELMDVRMEIDAEHPNDNRERVNVGAEVELLQLITLRGGYRYNYDDEDLTLGVGLNIPVGRSIVQFDYAYSRYDLLPDVHRFGIGLEL
jgi:hypothetical protein